MKIIIKTFTGHEGRPGQVGGSVPRKGKLAEDGSHIEVSLFSAIEDHPDRYKNICDALGVTSVTPRGVANHMNAIFAYQDDVTGMYTKVEKVMFVPTSGTEASIMIQGHIFTDGGNRVGNFTRKVHLNGKGERVVDHDLFILDEGYKKNGFGTRFFEACENKYIDDGFDKITTFASLSVGGYAWARMGMDFRTHVEDDYQAVTYVQKVLESVYDIWNRRYSKVSIPNLKHSWEVAMLTGPDGYEVGREAMAGSDWYGVKDLHNPVQLAIGRAYYDAKRNVGKMLKEQPRMELQTKDLGDGSFATVLVPAQENTPDWYCVGGKSTEIKSFPGHAGRPGKRGGSVPRSATDKADNGPYMPYSAVSERAGRLFQSKSIKDILRKFNVTSGTVDDLPADLYGKLTSYIDAIKSKQELPSNLTRFKKFMGNEAIWELERFSDAHDSGNEANDIVEGGVHFSASTPKWHRELILGTLDQYQISDDTLQFVRKFSTEPPNGYDENWKDMFGGGVLGLCHRVTAKEADIHIRMGRHANDISKTIIHEVGHALHIYELANDKALQEAVVKAWSNFSHNFRTKMAKDPEEANNFLKSHGLRRYSMTNENEFFADIFATFKFMPGSDEANNLEQLLPEIMLNAIL